MYATLSATFGITLSVILIYYEIDVNDYFRDLINKSAERLAEALVIAPIIYVIKHIEFPVKFELLEEVEAIISTNETMQ